MLFCLCRRRKGCQIDISQHVLKPAHDGWYGSLVKNNSVGYLPFLFSFHVFLMHTKITKSGFQTMRIWILKIYTKHVFYFDILFTMVTALWLMSEGSSYFFENASKIAKYLSQIKRLTTFSYFPTTILMLLTLLHHTRRSILLSNDWLKIVYI